MSRKLTIGFSPCPNDTFIFDAMVNGKIDTNGLEFDVYMADVEELNEKAFKGDLDITKISYHAFGYLTDNYVLLDSGSALGKGCGPLLIKASDDELDLSKAKIAIPGKYTTANFLLSIAHPEAQQKEEMLFSSIEDEVHSGRVDAGLIIHENRFTYQNKGLKKIIDLGEYWESTTGELIPLGGIIIKRELSMELVHQVNSLIRKSIEYAYEHPNDVFPYMRSHAQEMEDDVMQQHVDLYVNQYSLDLGTEGRHAIEQMFNLAQQKGIIPTITKNIFIS